MGDLWLNFRDPDGVTKRVAVDRDEFVIGRQPDCDLAISDSRLSRKHAKISRSGSRFAIEDVGSSNGTDLNGQPVFDPVDIRDGDVLNFGGYEVKAEIKDSPEVAQIPAAVEKPTQPPTAKPKAEAKESRSIPIWLILLVPALAAVLVVAAAGIVYVVSKNSANVATNPDNDPIGDTDDDNPVKTDDPPSGTNVTSTPIPAGSQPTGATSDDPGGTVTTASPATLSETSKVEVNGAGFLRKIAQNNPNAFLTTEQAQRVNARVKQFQGSSAIADNINSARKNAKELQSLATKLNVKPQLLAVAAIAKLGTARGSVLATAESMVDVFDKLKGSIGYEFADDCLLAIAAYDQAAAGETLKMRDMLQKLANERTESSRTIRSIWFLQKNGKITQAEFDKALNFLAIGTIAQNPKDFGVNAEALNL